MSLGTPVFKDRKILGDMTIVRQETLLWDIFSRTNWGKVAESKKSYDNWKKATIRDETYDNIRQSSLFFKTLKTIWDKFESVKVY